MRRVVSVCLPTWPTDRLRRRSSTVAPPGKPLVTVAREGGRRILASACAAARQTGLAPGLALAQARALVPDLTVADADPAGEAVDLVRLAETCLLRYTPLAAADPPDGLWLDITGCAHLFGGEAALLAHLVAWLRGGGLNARAAAADTPGAAHAVARLGEMDEAGTAIVPPGAQAAALAPLPLAGLRLPADVVAGLRGLGLEQIGQVIGLPRAALARRFGPEPGRRLDQALGHRAEPLDPVALPETPRVRLCFAEPLGDAENLARAIGDLAGALCRDLESRGQGARRLDFLLRDADGQRQAVRVGTARPTRDAMHLTRLLTDRLETVDPGSGIEWMALSASLTETLAAAQIAADGLGADPPEPDLSRVVDTLANRLGPGRVFRADAAQSEVPERSVRRVPALAADPGPSWPAPAWPRPSRLFARPEPVTAVALLPDHPPVRFTWRGATYPVVRADGPERIFGEWWGAPGETHAVRDYFAVEDEVGRRYWLFRRGDGENPATGGMGWFIHGLFG